MHPRNDHALSERPSAGLAIGVVVFLVGDDCIHWIVVVADDGYGSFVELCRNIRFVVVCCSIETGKL